MEPAEKRASQPWWVWTSIWGGVVLSLFTVMMMMVVMVVVVVGQSKDISIIIESTQVILWVLLMDVDSPNLKPRPALENAAACLVYISHTINILTTLLATVALLQVFVLGGLMISLSANNICISKTKFPGGVPSGAMLGHVGDCDGGCPTCSLLCLIFYSTQVSIIL